MIFRSPYPDIEIPEISLTAFALRHAERLADKPALIDGTNGRALTYGALAETIRRVAAGLAQRGVRKGDAFAIYAPNSLEYVVAFHAVASLGGIVVPLNPAYTVDELSHVLDDTGAVYLLTGPGGLDRATEAARRCGIREVFVFGEAQGVTPFASLLTSDGEPPIVPIDPRRDVVYLPYSSGTTGLPKGVMRTHFSLVASASQWVSAGELAEDDVLPGYLPFFHAVGVLLTLNLGLMAGATSVLMPRFDLASLLQLVQDYGITRLNVVPPIVVALAKEPMVDDYDLSTVRAVVCGGAPVGEDVARLCAARLGCPVKQMYGMTEVGATHSAPDDLDPSKIGSIGPCLPNTECKVIDVVTGTELGPGQQGELWVRTPAMMKGYFNQPDATAATIDAGGWLHTGDVGSADEDGWFTIVDRLKELIKYKAYQVAPAELEAILLSHPAVADAAVIPSPDARAGEVPKAFVVLKTGATPEELMAFVAARVAPYKKVRLVEFVELIPRSPSGKILRRVLVERERTALLARV
jgi:acyl-CoA synthetase (AMP-forming)/AMP-acid ligase II